MKLRMIPQDKIGGEMEAREKAKQAIIELFREKDELSYSEIVLRLNLDLKLVVTICAELESMGMIEAVL